jgi:hypothetical protein
LVALHNFILVHNPQAAKIHLTGYDSDHAPGGFYAGDDSLIPTGTGVDVEEEQNISEATIRRNKIADDMWRQYQEVLHQRSLDGMADEESDEDNDEDNPEESDDTDSDNDFYV